MYHQTYKISYETSDYRIQKNLYVAYSLWQAWFSEKPVEVRTEDTLKEGHYTLFSGISETEFRLFLLPVDIQKITMVNNNSSVTVDFEDDIIIYYSQDAKVEEIEKSIKMLCDSTATYSRLEMSSMVERDNLPAVWNNEAMEALLLNKLLSLPSGLYSKCGIAVMVGNTFETIWNFSALNGVKIKELMRYDKSSNTFVGYSSANRKFVAYSLSQVDKDYILNYIDNIRKNS